MSLPTQRPTGRTGVSESEAWWSRSPAPISIPLDPALTRRELARLPKAPERIRTAYEQRGSPPVLPALVREIANELNLHQRQVENVLSLLPRKRETMTKTEAMTEAKTKAPPRLTALLPTERPAAFRNLNWDRAWKIADLLEGLGVDLRYFVAESVTARIAGELNTTNTNVSQYTSAVRRACGIECLGRRPEGGAVEQSAPVAEPAEWEPAPALCASCKDDGAADGCSECGAWDKASLAALLPPTEAQRARRLLEAELLDHKTQCEAAVQRAKTAEAQLEQTMEHCAKLEGKPNETVCLRCKDQAADYCAACIRVEKSELGKRFSRLASEVEGAHQVLNDLGVPTDVDGPLTLAGRIRAYDRAPSIPADWTPTTANIHALPEPLRRYWETMERSVQADDERLAALQARDTPQPVVVRLTQDEASLVGLIAAHGIGATLLEEMEVLSVAPQRVPALLRAAADVAEPLAGRLAP